VRRRVTAASDNEHTASTEAQSHKEIAPRKALPHPAGWMRLLRPETGLAQSPHMSGRDGAVTSGSSSSLQPMRWILGRLPSNLAAAGFVVCHLSPRELSSDRQLALDDGVFRARSLARPARPGRVCHLPMVIHGSVAATHRGMGWSEHERQ
jgi:hypothetical protein